MRKATYIQKVTIRVFHARFLKLGGSEVVVLVRDLLHNFTPRCPKHTGNRKTLGRVVIPGIILPPTSG